MRIKDGLSIMDIFLRQTSSFKISRTLLKEDNRVHFFQVVVCKVSALFAFYPAVLAENQVRRIAGHPLSDNQSIQEKNRKMRQM